MSNKACRVCHQPLFEEVLLRYENMPKSAQFFPTVYELEYEKGNDLEVYQCSGCGLIQLNNEPVHYYREVIRAAGISAEMATFRQKEFANWIQKYKLAGKRILEVGCGQGEYLIILHQQNVEAYGVEYGQHAYEAGVAKGLTVERAFINSAVQKLEHAPFDGFMMLNFLEHLPEPNQTLQGIANNLTENAVGLVEVPNFDMILRENMFSEFISDHLFYFSKETLISTLNRNGFEVLECNETWHDYSLSAVVRKRSITNLTSFQLCQQQLTEALHSYIEQFESVAIWGAGHQALAIMSLADLGGKICYIVDSALFKQNKFTPASHIPIFSPDKLNADPVEAVIVMAASYSIEVVDIIKKNFNHIKNVATLSGNGVQPV